eukprot:8922275-Prorocentrum_lima.AAC.1
MNGAMMGDGIVYNHEGEAEEEPSAPHQEEQPNPIARSSMHILILNGETSTFTDNEHEWEWHGK